MMSSTVETCLHSTDPSLSPAVVASRAVSLYEQADEVPFEPLTVLVPRPVAVSQYRTAPGSFLSFLDDDPIEQEEDDKENAPRDFSMIQAPRTSSPAPAEAAVEPLAETHRTDCSLFKVHSAAKLMLQKRERESHGLRCHKMASAAKRRARSPLSEQGTIIFCDSNH